MYCTLSVSIINIELKNLIIIKKQTKSLHKGNTVPEPVRNIKKFLWQFVCLLNLCVWYKNTDNYLMLFSA